MKNSGLSLPQQRNNDYSLKLAFEVTREKLANITDIAGQCQKCGAGFQVENSKNIVTLSYLNRPCRISLPDMTVDFIDSPEELTVREKLLILHYFVHAKGTPLSHKMVSFKELPEVKNYFRTFYLRAIQPFVAAFGKEPDNLLKIAQSCGGSKADYGDIAVTIAAFSRVPVTLVLWQGNEEFPPDGSVMFDSTISDYLPAEDIIVLSEILARKLVKGAGNKI